MRDFFLQAYRRLGGQVRDVVDGVRLFGHTGSVRGFAAAMWHYGSVRQPS